MLLVKGRVVQETLARLSEIAEGEGLLLRPYKKDRSVYVIRRNKGAIQVCERGFANNDFRVPEGKVKKILKTLCKREFPRSNKVWLTPCSAAEIVACVKAWEQDPIGSPRHHGSAARAG